MKASNSLFFNQEQVFKYRISSRIQTKVHCLAIVSWLPALFLEGHIRLADLKISISSRAPSAKPLCFKGCPFIWYTEHILVKNQLSVPSLNE